MLLIFAAAAPTDYAIAVDETALVAELGQLHLLLQILIQIAAVGFTSFHFEGAGCRRSIQLVNLLQLIVNGFWRSGPRSIHR